MAAIRVDPPEFTANPHQDGINRSADNTTGIQAGR